MTQVAVAAGSNLQPEENLPDAVARLRAHPELRLSALSRTYATAPVGPAGQSDFHNLVGLVETDLGPLELRHRLRAIEADMGRMRSEDRFAPRPIDLDIVFYDSLVVITDRLRIPDPDALRHAHIFVPLAEVAPGWRPPGQPMTAADVAAGHSLAVVEASSGRHQD